MGKKNSQQPNQGFYVHRSKSTQEVSDSRFEGPRLMPETWQTHGILSKICVKHCQSSNHSYGPTSSYRWNELTPVTSWQKTPCPEIAATNSCYCQMARQHTRSHQHRSEAVSEALCSVLGILYRDIGQLCTSAALGVAFPCSSFEIIPTAAMFLVSTPCCLPGHLASEAPDERCWSSWSLPCRTQLEHNPFPYY